MAASNLTSVLGSSKGKFYALKQSAQKLSHLAPFLQINVPGRHFTISVDHPSGHPAIPIRRSSPCYHETKITYIVAHQRIHLLGDCLNGS